MKIQFLLALLPLVLVGCAASPKMAVIDAAQPINAASETESVFVGAITITDEVKTGDIGKFHGGLANIAYSTHSGELLSGMERRFRIMVHDELTTAGYQVSGEKHTMISASAIIPPQGAVFMVEGIVEEVRFDTYSSVAELSTKSTATVAWRLTDLRIGKAVYELKTKGAAEGPIEDVAVIVEAARGSIRMLLADPIFLALVQKPPG